MSAHALDRGRGDADAGRTIRMWAAWLAGPVAWAIHLGASYPLVYWACETGRHHVLHVITAGTLLLALGGLALAWRFWRDAGRRWPDESGTPAARTRFLAATAVVLGALFAVVILVEGLPVFMLDACR